jgi:hypothetical protein
MEPNKGLLREIGRQLRIARQPIEVAVDPLEVRVEQLLELRQPSLR